MVLAALYSEIDHQVLRLLVVKNQFMWVEALGLVFRARVVVLAHLYLLRSSQDVEDNLYVRSLSMWPKISLDEHMDPPNRVLTLTLSYSDFCSERWLQNGKGGTSRGDRGRSRGATRGVHGVTQFGIRLGQCYDILGKPETKAYNIVI